MGLFERKTTPVTIPLYSIGSEKTLLVVGLGNVGKTYALTRHNIGFMCLDHIAELNNLEWKEKKSLKCLLAETKMGQSRVVFIKPTTLMNLSGDAVQAVRQFYKIDLQDIVIVHDELAVPFGTIRVRKGGSDAGNNGIKSVTTAIGADYTRVRVGIKNDRLIKEDAAAFVLKNFSKEEQGYFKPLFAEANALVTEFIFAGQLPADTRKFI